MKKHRRLLGYVYGQRKLANVMKQQMAGCIWWSYKNI